MLSHCAIVSNTFELERTEANSSCSKDTLRSPPPENQTMKKASMISIFITTFFYLCCGCFGYAAFGDGTPGNLLTGFGFYEPYWLIDFANACIVLHLVGGYQVNPSTCLSMLAIMITSDSEVSGFDLLGLQPASVFLCRQMGCREVS